MRIRSSDSSAEPLVTAWGWRDVMGRSTVDSAAPLDFDFAVLFVRELVLDAALAVAALALGDFAPDPLVEDLASEAVAFDVLVFDVLAFDALALGDLESVDLRGSVDLDEGMDRR